MEAARAEVFGEPEPIIPSDPIARQFGEAQTDEEVAKVLAHQVVGPLAMDGQDVNRIFDTGNPIHQRALEIFHTEDLLGD